MQWLIDMVKEIIHGQLGYFNRGNNVPNDFTTGEFTLDGAWHELDLSGIVPEDARAVNLKVNIRASVIDHKFEVREAGIANAINVLTLWTQVTFIRLGGVFTINLRSDRSIEYRADVGNWTLVYMNVNGWWLR